MVNFITLAASEGKSHWCMPASSQSSVSGPLSWRTFHQLVSFVFKGAVTFVTTSRRSLPLDAALRVGIYIPFPSSAHLKKKGYQVVDNSSILWMNYWHNVIIQHLFLRCWGTSNLSMQVLRWWVASSRSASCTGFATCQVVALSDHFLPRASALAVQHISLSRCAPENLGSPHPVYHQFARVCHLLWDDYEMVSTDPLIQHDVLQRFIAPTLRSRWN